MTDVKNIKPQETSSNSASTEGSSSSPENSTLINNFAELEGLRNKITEKSTAANSAKSQATEYTHQAQQYKSEAENSSSASSAKQLIQMAKEMIQKAKEMITVMREAVAEAKDAKTELGNKSKSVNGTENASQVDAEDPNGFLFNQKPDKPINI